MASYGNSSTLRRLYISLSILQKKSATIVRTFGITPNIVAMNNRTLSTIAEIGKTMQQFHKAEPKIIANLTELVDEEIRSTSNKIEVFRTEINPALIEVVKNYKGIYTDLELNHKEIAKDLGMTIKLCKRCIDIIKS